MAKKKEAKETAEYTDRGTDEEHCSICSHYVNSTTCEIVAGKIAPRGWCKHFDRRRPVVHRAAA